MMYLDSAITSLQSSCHCYCGLHARRIHRKLCMHIVDLMQKAILDHALSLTVSDDIVDCLL